MDSRCNSTYIQIYTIIKILMNNWKKYLKTYCCLYYNEIKSEHIYEYFNELKELVNYEGEHPELRLVSVQRLWW